MDNHIIQINNLVKIYGKKQVLKDLSLSIPMGSVYGLLGKNGEGKTTLIKCLLGLLRPSAGSVRTLCDDPWNFRDQTKAQLSYVPQSDRLYPWLTVRQIIDYTASFYRHWNKDLIDRLVKEWRIDWEDKVGLLSEGQAQKVSILLSLGHEPQLLVFDEPVASLDPQARREFLKTILEIVSGRECTVFFSTHITSDLERVADHVAILNNGGIAFDGELDMLKEGFKRLRILAQHPLPADFSFNGCLRCETSDNGAIVTVNNYSSQLKEDLEKKYEAKVQIEDLNLEEIFLELTQ